MNYIVFRYSNVNKASLCFRLRKLNQGQKEKDGDAK